MLKMEPTAQVAAVRQTLLSVQQEMMSRPYVANLHFYYDVDPM